jgi:hypothetical protein
MDMRGRGAPSARHVVSCEQVALIRSISRAAIFPRSTGTQCGFYGDREITQSISPLARGMRLAEPPGWAGSDKYGFCLGRCLIAHAVALE